MQYSSYVHCMVLHYITSKMMVYNPCSQVQSQYSGTIPVLRYNPCTQVQSLFSEIYQKFQSATHSNTIRSFLKKSTNRKQITGPVDFQISNFVYIEATRNNVMFSSCHPCHMYSTICIVDLVGIKLTIIIATTSQKKCTKQFGVPVIRSNTEPGCAGAVPLLIML